MSQAHGAQSSCTACSSRAAAAPVLFWCRCRCWRQQRMVVLGAGLGRGAAAGWDVCECSMRSAGRNSMSSFAALPHVWPLAPSSFWALHGPISCNSDTVLSVSSSPLSQKHPAPWQRVWPRKPERRGLSRDLELDFHPLRSEMEAKASVLSPEFVCRWGSVPRVWRRCCLW